MARSSFVSNPARIKVIGLGGGGCNAVTRMVRENIQGVEFIAMNTDAQALAICEAPTCVQLGAKITKGLGVGGDPHFGQKAAEENRDELKDVVAGSDMVFITAGMGGGTGTGSAPVVAEIAKGGRPQEGVEALRRPLSQKHLPANAGVSAHKRGE